MNFAVAFKPLTKDDIADVLGISTSGVSDIIKRANAASGNTFAHICNWRRNYVTSGPPSPICTSGSSRRRLRATRRNSSIFQI